MTSDITERIARAIALADLENQSEVDAYFSATVHNGDCTNQIHSCFVCLAAMYKTQARAVLQSLADANKVKSHD